MASIAVAVLVAGYFAYYYYQLSGPRAPTESSSGDVPAASGLEDKFGIKMLYSTRPDGREWFMNMGYPNADGVFELRDQTIKRLDGGYWYAQGQFPDYQTRILVESPPGTDLWKNVEITGYFRVMKVFPKASGAVTNATDTAESDYAIQAYARGGIHSNQLMEGTDGKERYLNCLGSAYKGKFYINGDASVAKEIGHPVYAPERFGGKQIESGTNFTSWTRVGKGVFQPLVQNVSSAVTDGSSQPGRWVGLKVVIYDFIENGQEYARIQTYIDDKADDNGRLVPSNEWVLLADVADKGDWVADPKGTASKAVNTLDELIARCGNPFHTRQEYAQMIISWYGHPDFINDPIYRPIANAVNFRWDYSGVEFAYLSAREIGGPR